MQEFRDNFPLPSQEVLRSLGPAFNPEKMSLAFDTDNSQVDSLLLDPNNTPLVLPVCIVAPFFQASRDQGHKPFRYRNEYVVPEGDTVESLLEALFPSLITADTDRNSPFFCNAALQSAWKHNSSRESVVLVHTYRGRCFVIPRKTSLKEIFAGARWPRDSPPPFEDMGNSSGMRNAEEVDGVELCQGWFMEIWVVPCDKLAQQ